MPNITTLKNKLINESWLPEVKEAKKLIYPRRRKNARMRLLTLTDGIEMKEIFKFEEEKLLERQEVVAWVKTMIKRSRAEAESIGNVLDGSVYDESFLGSSCSVNNHFPFDIVNLDFHSQEPANDPGRLETETEKLEVVINLQKQAGCNKFLLIYTTLLDPCDFNTSIVVRASNTVLVNNWNGLNLSGFAETISTLDEKKSFLEVFVNEVIRKHGYQCEGGIKNLSNASLSDSENLFSLSAILVKENE